MFSVLSSKFKVIRCVSAIALFAFISCGGEGDKHPKDTAKDTATVVTPPVADEPPPFEINLLPGYKINKQQGADFVVYYFQAEDTSQSHNEGGIYFGNAPDTSAPRMQEYTKRQFRDVFMGDTATWTEYTTATYVQREVYLELGPQEKIHSWCYSNDPAVLEQLFAMIKSIH